LAFALTISCGALEKKAISARERPTDPERSITRHALSVLISSLRPLRLVDVHPVRVLASRSTTGSALARILLLPQTLRDFLEHYVERFLVFGALARLGGVMLCEGDELRV